ncbi:DUF1361 domain-containing protein [Siphonobacter sp.]|uniref:DUF1361 domain-containing protein n=1 Tax=Siphonobacter sp. TaxID=1869184 RepID=UPI003B3B421F
MKSRTFQLASLTALSLLSASFLVIRFGLLRSGWYVMINWNLFLAWLPLVFSLWFEKLTHQPSRLKLVAVGTLWLLFFPNAPYVITDLIHIQNTMGIPVWHDAVMIFSYAFVSLLCGLLSFHWMRKNLLRILPQWADYLMLAALPLSSFGIYLGRVKRLNSWHPFTHPTLLVRQILESLVSKQAMLMTLEFSVLLGISYLMLLSLMENERSY